MDLLASLVLLIAIISATSSGTRAIIEGRLAGQVHAVRESSLHFPARGIRSEFLAVLQQVAHIALGHILQENLQEKK